MATLMDRPPPGFPLRKPTRRVARVAGGRSGQRGNDHRKTASDGRAPRAGVPEPQRPDRSNHLTTARPLAPDHLARRVWHPNRGAGLLLRRCPEVAAPTDLSGPERRIYPNPCSSVRGAHAPPRVATGALTGRSRADTTHQGVNCARLPCFPRGRGKLHAGARSLPIPTAWIGIYAAGVASSSLLYTGGSLSSELELERIRVLRILHAARDWTRFFSKS